jgi:hypothetical protein
MVEIERKAGEAVRVGRYTLRVIAVRPGEVVIALLDPDKDCAGCGERPAQRRRCPVCGAEAVLCNACLPSRRCPRCASPWA